jgi:hypothetical protein
VRRLLAAGSAMIFAAGIALVGSSPASALPSKAVIALSPNSEIVDGQWQTPKGIFVVRGSSINLVSRESKIPVRIQNNYDTELRVHVHIRANNNRVSLPKAVEIVVPAFTTVNAQVPVQAIANGEVALEVWLTTFSGIKIGESVGLQMQVNADIEFVMLLGFGAAVLTLGTFGVIRTLHKNRRNFAEASV